MILNLLVHYDAACCGAKEFNVPTKTTTTKSAGFSDAEKAAARERVKELKRSGDQEAEAREVMQKLAEMPEPDRSMGERVHALVTSVSPELAPKTYYGMPAYAKDGKVICFFKPKSKFKVRYASFEFNPDAKLDDGAMWPVSFALTELTPTTEAQIKELVKKAIS
jgi:uncharacterized protein YdhG (YjbR/CyaY superfamily)